MTNLLIIRGLPGSGKSSLAQVAVAAGFTHLEDDMYHHTDEGDYEFEWARNDAAFEWLLHTTKRLLMHGQSVVVSSVFTTNATMAPYFKFCEACGIRITVARMEADHGNIHDVPKWVLGKMRDEYEVLNLA
jgi:predicted kinase